MDEGRASYLGDPSSNPGFVLIYSDKKLEQKNGIKSVTNSNKNKYDIYRWLLCRCPYKL